MNDRDFTFVVPRVRSARLLLREPRMDDFESIARENADPTSRAFLDGPIDRRESWRRWMSGAGNWVIQGMGWWTVELPEVGSIGTVGVFRRESHPDIELGWMIDRSRWGHGYAAEAAAAARDFACRERGAVRIIAHIAPSNQRSIRVAERLGMVCEGEVDFYGEMDLRYAYVAVRPPTS